MPSDYTQLVQIVANAPSLGRQLLFDDIEDLFKWAGLGTGADWTVEKSNTWAYNGNRGMHLKTRTTTPGANDFVTASRYFCRTPIKRFQFSCHWQNSSGVLLNILRFELFFQYPLATYRARIQWARATGIVTLSTETGDFEIPDLQQEISMNNVNRFTLSFDIDTKRYLRATLNDLSADLQEYQLHHTEAALPVHSRLDITINTVGADPAYIHIDDVLIEEH